MNIYSKLQLHFDRIRFLFVCSALPYHSPLVTREKMLRPTVSNHHHPPHRVIQIIIIIIIIETETIETGIDIPPRVTVNIPTVIVGMRRIGSVGSAKPITSIKIPVANAVTQLRLTNHRLIIIIIIIVVVEVEDNETMIPIMTSIAVVIQEIPTHDVTIPTIQKTSSNNPPATVMEGAGDIRAEGRGFIPMIATVTMGGMTTTATAVTDAKRGETKIENAVTTPKTVTTTARTPTTPTVRGSHNNRNRRNQGDSRRRGHRTLNHRVRRTSLTHGRDSFMMR